MVLAMVASCYSGHAAPGSPCTPELDNCPHDQTCALVSGAYICVAGPVPDAALAVDAALVDAPRMIDAAIDAPPPPPPPWSLVQSKSVENTGSLAIAATGSKHLIVVGVETLLADTVTSVTDNAGNTYVAVPKRAVSTVVNVGLEIWYSAGAKAGATTITVTSNSTRAIVAWEFTNIKTTGPLDNGTKVDNQAASTTPLGASIVTAQDRELVIATIIVQNQVSGIHANSAFTNDQTALGNGWAHLTSNNAPAGTYQAQWDQPTTGASCAVSAAFFVGP